LIWAAGIFLLTFVLSLVAFGALIIALPPRYFVEESCFWTGRHPLIRWLWVIGKNLLGLILIALGVVLSLPGIPGQGVLTILIGLMLVDIPGKYRLKRAVANRKSLLRNMNRLRAYFGRPPLTTD